MAYTTIDKPSDYFNTKLYTGNGGTQAISGIGFAPNWVWIKRRDGSAFHVVTDSVRGATKQIYPNDNQAEGTRAQGLQSFDSDGYTLGNEGDTNASSSTYVGWNWKAGTSFTNDASATGIGTIDSTGSASDTAGFSIVSYSGTGGAGTIKHGLSTAPSMIIVKVRTGRTSDWLVYHKGIASDAQTDCIKLNETGAAFDEATIWNDTAPTSSVFSVGTEDTVSGSGNTFIAYCFSEVKGYSKFGSYNGNSNADGTFVYTGFKPAFVMVKMINGADDWQILDNKRSPHNIVGGYLLPNSSSATINNDVIDFTATGFKLRKTFGSWNHSSYQYLYMAFAEESFVSSSGVPATAR